MKAQLLVSLTAFFAFFGGDAYAQFEHPTTGAVYHTKEASYIWYDCKLKNPTTLECEFTFSSVRKKSKPEDWENDLAELDENFEDLRRDWERADKTNLCAGLAKLSDILTGDSPPPEDATKELSEIPEGQRADMQNILNASKQLCQNFSKSAAMEVGRLEHDKNARTCKVYSSFDRQTFSWEGEGNWVSVQKNRGLFCSSVVIERFERPDPPVYNFWNFFRRVTITNPEKKIIEQTCREFSDDTEHKFRWNTRELFLNCDYIEFGL